MNAMVRSGYRHGDEGGIYMNASAAEGFPLLLGQPYRAAEGRVAVVAAGKLEVTLDLVDYSLLAGDMFFLPPGSVACFNHIGDGCTVHVAIFRNLPGRAGGAESLMVQSDTDAAARTMRYLELLYDQFGRQPVHPEVIEPLFEALVLDTLTLRPQAEPTPSSSLLHRFVRMVNAEGSVKRTAAWYADRLCLSPSRLSTVVKEGSGMTPQQWIDRALVQEAKIQLRHTDLPVAEVAERLGFATPSFFIHFFRTHTGVTPLQFRKGRNI